VPPSSSRHLPLLGIALKLASVAVFAGMTVCVKFLGRDIPSGQTIFVRGVISVVVLALIAWGTEGLHLLKTSNWRRHALRSLSGTASMFCLFAAVTMLPLADLTAITFTAPMFLTVLAMVFLGERIHRFRWTALGIGFIGVLITIGPHLSFGHGAWFGLAAYAAAMAPPLRAVLFAYLGAVAFTRMTFGAHFPLDVAVGAIVGTTVGRFSVALTRAAALLPARPGPERDHVAAGLGTVAAA